MLVVDCVNRTLYKSSRRGGRSRRRRVDQNITGRHEKTPVAGVRVQCCSLTRRADQMNPSHRIDPRTESSELQDQERVMRCHRLFEIVRAPRYQDTEGCSLLLLDR